MHCNMSPQKDRLTHAGRVKTAKLAARVEPEALLAVLKNPSYHFKRIGLEAGPLSQWLYSAPNQVLHQPLGGPPIPFLVVARRIPGYSRRGDAKAGHRRVTMFYRILRRILRKHALYHLLIPLFAGLLVEAGYTYLFDNAEWQNLFIHLGSGPRIALYLGIVLAYLIVVGILIRQETKIGLRQLDFNVLAANLRDAKDLFAVGTMRFDEWFDPIVQVYLATVYERRYQAEVDDTQFNYERILLLASRSARKDLGSDYLDGYLAKCLVATHKRLHINLYFMEWHDIIGILNQLTAQQKVKLKYYPKLFRYLPDGLAKILMIFVGRRRRVRKLAIGVIEKADNSKYAFRFSKRDRLLSVRPEPTADTAADFVQLIRNTIYAPAIAGQPRTVQPQFDFANFF